jgi:hypothetical protein
MLDNPSPIWIGQFGPCAPEEYFVQKYNEDDDAASCQFAADQGVSSFDYDFVEISWGGDCMEDVRRFIDGHSYSEAYIDQVVAKASELGVKEINVFVLGKKEDFPHPRSVFGDDFKLWYCGDFDCAGP